MNKYWYIIRNSFKETNRSKLIFLVTLSQPLILLYGYILFYGFLINPGHVVAYDNPIVAYYIFILVVSAIDLTRFANDLQKKIQDESYIGIDKLPVNPFLYYFFVSLGRSILTFIILQFVGIAYLISIKFNILGVVLFIPATIIAFFLAHLIFFVLTSFTFFLESLHVWLFGITTDFLSGKLIPLHLMPVGLSSFLLLFPFPYAFGGLAQNYSNFDLHNLLISLLMAVVWSGLLFFVAIKLWNKGSYYFQEHG
ncbi:MAG: hypothetical protein M3Q44_05715 [bacterium]|nr:hypothetical protein [bacterium]